MKAKKVSDGLDKSIHVHQSAKVDFDLKLHSKFNLTNKQKEFLELAAAKTTKMILVKGPAGSAKSYLAIYAALQAIQEKRVGSLLYLRQPVESSSYNIGFLKGDEKLKLQPYMAVLLDKINELVPVDSIKRLEKEDRLKSNTIGFLRGASLNATFIIADESQNFTKADLLLIMSRFGRFSKLLICGDLRQSDIKNSGFEKIYNLFDNEESRKEGIYTFSLKREDIVREPIISFILDQFEKLDFNTLKS